MNNAPESRDHFELPPEEGLELRLQRLVDGELDDSSSASLLEDLEDAEDGWRKCALAFIESQLWDQTLAPAGLIEPEATDPVLSSDINPTTTQVQTQPEAAHNFSWGQLLTLAACLALAFFLGRQLSPNSPSPTDTNLSALPNEPEPRLQVVGEIELKPRGNEVGGPHRLPVLAGSAEFSDRSSIPDSLFRQLQDAGFRVDRSTSFQTLPVGDEGVMFIPVEQVDLKAPRRFIP